MMRAAVALLLLVSLTAVTSPAMAQPQPARVLVASPIFLRPDPSRTPLVTAPAGMPVKVMALEGDWCRVQFRDNQGERIGFIESKFIEYLQVPPDIAAPPSNLNAASVEASPVPRTRSTFSPMSYTDAQLTVPSGDETKQIDVLINYASDRFQLSSANILFTPPLAQDDIRDVARPGSAMRRPDSPPEADGRSHGRSLCRLEDVQECLVPDSRAAGRGCNERPTAAGRVGDAAH
jgi:hypothetical protein